ncbi:MAG: UDP binding domain-containing protein [Oscillospiraceae bacterium]
MLDKLAHYFVGHQCHDPWFQKITDGQVMDFDAFLEQVDLVVVLVAHSHIIENQQRLDGKIVYDTRNCIDRADKLYKL